MDSKPTENRVPDRPMVLCYIPLVKELCAKSERRMCMVQPVVYNTNPKRKRGDVNTSLTLRVGLPRGTVICNRASLNQNLMGFDDRVR